MKQQPPKESHLLVNKWSAPDGTILISRHRHDFVSHEDAEGNLYYLDGGTEYIRTSGNLKNECVYTDSSFEVIREYFTWGSYGVDGMQPKKITKLKDLGEDHINAILRTQNNLPKYMKELFKSELEYRLNKE